MSKFTLNPHSRLGPRPGNFPLGSWESRAAARAELLARDQEIQEKQAALIENMTEVERAFVEGSNGTVKPSYALHLILDAWVKKCKLFGLPAPTPEDVLHKWQVLKEVAKIEEERAAQGDWSFVNKEALREMAEDRLRGERRGGAKSESTTAETSEEEE